MTTRTSCALVALLALALLPAAATASATLVIANIDGPGEGFNDATPAAPVGSNPGTTVGQQRLNAFQHAANLWGAVLDSGVPIVIQSSFDPLTCTPTSAVLGSAGTIQIFADVDTSVLELANTWYHVALANKLFGGDLAPGAQGTSADDIRARFNSNIGNPGCLTGIGWYYGLDGNHGTQIDLVTVLLHEFGHGLGFSTFTSSSTGNRIAGLGDVYAQYALDVTQGKVWNQLTSPQVVASALNTRKLVWDGLHVSTSAPAVLSLGTPLLRVNSPAGLGPYDVGAAAFGPLLVAPGTSGNLVVGIDPADGAGPSTTDGCSPLTNAVAGNVVLLDRGTCGFTVKVKNAQNAGAVAAVIADNVAGSPPAGLGGVDPTITIPSARVTLAAGNALKAGLGGGSVNVTLGVDPTVRAGVQPNTGFVMLYTPNPLQPGSSVSHWDTLAFRNLLMEPAINADLTHSVSVPQDLTLEEMKDIGWFSDHDGVPDGADACLGSTPTVTVGGCDSGVTNDVFANGCTVADQVNACANGAGNHGAFVSCVAHVTNDLKKQGVITGAEKGAIQSCAAGAAIP
ncbi:MAG TPA: PA domain-containing protein [Thermoanaerobaculia bacterium]|jgi:hypothetical protein|nr:PA domain-containing protein [Thermoanaerobaculia bacterium]